jgi:hypothetical protein
VSRPQLVRRILNSFLRCCQDLDLVDEMIAVDDGTPPGELDELRKIYGRWRIVSNPGKGHPQALNFLFGLPRNRLVFHLEDDWLFRIPGHFIRQPPFPHHRPTLQCILRAR